ncbi:hypothetical protein MMC11_005872 [Xylographa trunciseda]|nr:hypothetical protein [Xylographa trunciseda]
MAAPKVRGSTITPNGVSNNPFSKVSPNEIFHHGKRPSWESLSMSKAGSKSMRKASTNHGDLTSLRPKSPPLMVFMTPDSGIRHVPRSNHFDKASGLTLFSETPSVKPRLHRSDKTFAKTPTYDLEADLQFCRTRSQREYLSSICESLPQIRVILAGLNFSYESPVAVYKPKIQLPEAQYLLYTADQHDLSSLRHCPPIEQLDNCIVWTQLSFGTAEILYEIDRVITSCVEDLLADRLANLEMAVNKQVPIVHTTRAGTSNNSYLLSFSVSELVEATLERLRLDYYRHTSPLSPEVFQELFLLYLISRNNIDTKVVGGKTYGTVTLELRSGGGLHGLQSLAHVTQRSDSILFPCLDILPREGSMIEIRPRYHQGILDEGNDNYYANMTYSIVDQPPWLHWDEKISGWTGRVPMYSNLRGISNTGKQVINGGRDGPYAVLHLLRLEVKGTFFVRHSSLLVGLKRTVRTRLTLKVIPWYATKRVQPPLSPLQHESYSQNDSKAVDLRFQEYLSRCKEALEPRSGEYRMNQQYGSRIIDDIDGNIIDSQGIHNSHDMTTNSGDDPLDPLHIDYRHDAPLSPRPERVNPFIVGKYSEARRVRRTQDSSEIGSAYELGSYPASDLVLPSNHLVGSPISLRQGRLERPSLSFKSSCSEGSFKSWGNEDYHARDLQRKHSTSVDSHSKNELKDHLDWKDNHEYGTDVASLHEHDERGETLQYASPELYKIAQVLHQTEFQLSEAQQLNATQVEYRTPSKVSSRSRESIATSVGSDNRQDEIHKALPSDTNDEKEETDSYPESSGLAPYITCFINRFAPLRDLRTDSSGSGSTSSSLFLEGATAENNTAASGADRDQMRPSDEDTETITLEYYRKSDSRCYLADNEGETDVNLAFAGSTPQRVPSTEAEGVVSPDFSCSVEPIGKSIRSNSGYSTSSTASIQQLMSPQETPKLRPTSRQSSPMELLPDPALNLQPSPPYPKQSQMDTGLWQMESFDEINADPSICQEQALLWSVLANKENVSNAPKNDPKLKAEELKGLWEVLKYEARQKQRTGVSEETLGVESEEEYFASESEENGTSSSGGGNEDMEDTWNFGC